MLDGADGLLRLPLLDEAHECVDDHHRQDDGGVGVVADSHQDHDGAQQDLEQKIFKLREEAAQG